MSLYTRSNQAAAIREALTRRAEVPTAQREVCHAFLFSFFWGEGED